MAEPRSKLFAVSEHLALWSLAATVSLYTVGQVSRYYLLDAVGVHAWHSDAQWQDRVFEGGLGVVNMVLQAILEPARAHLPWLGILVVLTACLRGRRAAAARPRIRTALTLVSAASALALLIVLSITWGRLQAGLFREHHTIEDHFIFSPEAVPLLPKPLLQDNEQRALRLLTTTPEFFVVLSADLKVVYRIASKDVLLLETRRRAEAAKGDASAP